MKKEKTMQRTTIKPQELMLKPANVWENEWFLLAAGDLKGSSYNAMTVAWGSIGTMWSTPFVQVVVRPSRYTYSFMNNYDTFTLSHFSETYKNELSYLGSTSGKNVPDKIRISGLTPIAVPEVLAPGFKEADLIIACKKIYWQDMDKKHFIPEWIMDKYPPEGDYHRIYFGEILHCETVT